MFIKFKVISIRKVLITQQNLQAFLDSILNRSTLRIESKNLGWLVGWAQPQLVGQQVEVEVELNPPDEQVALFNL